MSSLHEAIVAFDMKRNQKLGTEGINQPLTHAVAGNSTHYAGSLSETGAGLQRKSLSIVPIKVRGKGEINEVITYALLDNGSTASFCSEDLLSKLGVEAKKCHISLPTISNVVENWDSATVGLEINNLNNTTSVDVPNVFGVKKLSTSKDEIANQEDIGSWDFLSDITLPRRRKDCTVNLLIGVDVPEALQPKEVRKGDKGGPFALKTKFGWTLNGPLRENETATAQCCMMATSQTTE